MLTLIQSSITSENGGCVEVVLDPRAVTLAAGPDAGLLGGRPRQGRRAGRRRHEDHRASTPTASPRRRARWSPGMPLAFQLTMGDKDKAQLVVEVASKRGIGLHAAGDPALQGLGRHVYRHRRLHAHADRAQRHRYDHGRALVDGAVPRRAASTAGATTRSLRRRSAARCTRRARWVTATTHATARRSPAWRRC